MKFESKYLAEEIKKDPSMLVGKFFIYKENSVLPRFIYKVKTEFYDFYGESEILSLKRFIIYYYDNTDFPAEECSFYFSSYFGDFSFFDLNKDFIII